MPDPVVYLVFVLLFVAAQAGALRARLPAAAAWLRVAASLVLVLLFPLSLLMLRGLYQNPYDAIPYEVVFFVLPLGIGPAIILYFYNVRKRGK